MHSRVTVGGRGVSGDEGALKGDSGPGGVNDLRWLIECVCYITHANARIHNQLLYGRGNAYEVIADKFNAKVYRRDMQASAHATAIIAIGANTSIIITISTTTMFLTRLSRTGSG